MDTQDNALSLSNPRLISAIYFTVLAIITTFFIDLILYLLGIDPLLPVFKKLLLSILVAASFGALFGERIVHSRRPYKLKTFFWAAFMVILAIPFYDLGFVYFLQSDHTTLFTHATFAQLCYLYLNVLLYSFLLLGLWIAAGAGLAALYLRGYLVYYLLDSRYQDFHAKQHEQQVEQGEVSTVAQDDGRYERPHE